MRSGGRACSRRTSRSRCPRRRSPPLERRLPASRRRGRSPPAARRRTRSRATRPAGEAPGPQQTLCRSGVRVRKACQPRALRPVELFADSSFLSAEPFSPRGRGEWLPRRAAGPTSGEPVHRGPRPPQSSASAGRGRRSRRARTALRAGSRTAEQRAKTASCSPIINSPASLWSASGGEPEEPCRLEGVGGVERRGREEDAAEDERVAGHRHRAAESLSGAECPSASRVDDLRPGEQADRDEREVLEVVDGRVGERVVVDRRHVPGTDHERPHRRC